MRKHHIKSRKAALVPRFIDKGIDRPDWIILAQIIKRTLDLATCNAEPSSGKKRVSASFLWLSLRVKWTSQLRAPKSENDPSETLL
jgi:hypothetical protein